MIPIPDPKEECLKAAAQAAFEKMATAGIALESAMKSAAQPTPAEQALVDAYVAAQNAYDGARNALDNYRMDRYLIRDRKRARREHRPVRY